MRFLAPHCGKEQAPRGLQGKLNPHPVRLAATGEAEDALARQGPTRGIDLNYPARPAAVHPLSRFPARRAQLRFRRGMLGPSRQSALPPLLTSARSPRRLRPSKTQHLPHEHRDGVRSGHTCTGAARQRSASGCPGALTAPRSGRETRRPAGARRPPARTPGRCAVGVSRVEDPGDLPGPLRRGGLDEPAGDGPPADGPGGLSTFPSTTSSPSA